MDYTKSVGNIVELQCMSKFMEMGFDCSIPYGDACKYDFIADLGGELIKIQCKASSNPSKNGIVDTGAFQIKTTHQTTNTKKTTHYKYSSLDIDYFATYYQGKVYVIPVEECSTSKTLRLIPPSNGQKEYNRAEDYLIETRFGHKVEKSFLYKKESKTNIKIKNFYCVQCKENQVSKEGGVCHVCSSFNKRTTERPNREELKDLIRNKTFVEIGKMFSVTDNTIRKWCAAEKLPTKKSDIKKISDKDWRNI